MVTKVKKTEKHSTTQGVYDVCTAQLVLIPITFDEYRSMANTIMIHKGEDREFYRPILASATELIGKNDFYILPRSKKIRIYDAKRAQNLRDPNGHGLLKVLALQDHFTTEQLMAIEDGKMKDGDLVLLACEDYGTGKLKFGGIGKPDMIDNDFRVKLPIKLFRAQSPKLNSPKFAMQVNTTMQDPEFIKILNWLKTMSSESRYPYIQNTPTETIVSDYKKFISGKTTVQELMDNNRWNFWKKDWSLRIIVEWDGKIPLVSFRDQIIEKLGKDFIFERALNSDDTEYTVTKKGLVASKKAAI